MQTSSVATPSMTTPKRNLRHHLRVPAKMSATLETNTGTTLSADIANLSRNGLLLACDRETLESIHAKDVTFSPNRHVPLLVRFTLNSKATGNLTLNVPCGVVHVRRLSREQFHVGVEFQQLDDSLIPLLEEYIESHREGSGTEAT